MVALSGGGDSVALTLAAAAWARRSGRPLLVLNVDHRLQAASAGWAQSCASLAERLGAGFQALAWEGDKPATGLPAAARAARHRLLADAARAAGARVILFGHTADDVLEARAMRVAGSTTPDPRPWSPSPAWPEGRGLHILRPLLAVRRADIRAWLAARGESWIDDPANEDLRYARPRARTAGGGGYDATIPRDRPPALAFTVDAAGVITLDRDVLRGCAADDAETVVGRACVCAGGGTRPPARVRLAALCARLRGADPFAATLAGAAVIATAATVRVQREPGEAARGGLATITVGPGETAVWDGRFEVTALDGSVEVRRHPTGSRARRASPLVHGGSAQVTCLVADRLAAALGQVQREPD